MSTEKKESTTQHTITANLRLMFRFMRGSRAPYAGAIAAMAVATVLGIVSPLVIRLSVDSIIGDKPMANLPGMVTELFNTVGGRSVLGQNLWIMSLILVAVAGLNGLFAFLKGKWSAMASEAMARRMRDALYDHLQRLPYDYHVKAETGDLVQRCTSDVETVRRFLSVQFTEIGRTLVMVAVTLPVMLQLSLPMTAAATYTIPVLFGFSLIFFSKVRTAFKKSDEAEGALSSVLQENLSGVRVVRAFARQEYEIEKFETRNRTFYELNYRLIWLNGWYWSLSDSIAMVQIGTVVVFGAWSAAHGTISLGTFMVFGSYTGMLLWPIRQMGRILTDMGKMFVSLSRIQDILDEPLEPEIPDARKPPVTGRIEFKDVTFGYEPDKPVLNGISFTAEPGETVAILGTTGSGKSSLVHLLAALYDYDGGSITVNGHELRTLDRAWLRKHVGIVLQEPFLYSKSVRDNIGLAKAEAGKEAVETAARIADIHDVITEFEKGYDTAVGEKGVTLSGGQKQRVALSRTLIRECPIRIFDDTLSAVDTETDARIRRALNAQEGTATTILISHRVTTLSRADRILVLEQGKIVQNGTHAELLKEPGLYKRIWGIQNKLEDELKHDN